MGCRIGQAAYDNAVYGSCAGAIEVITALSKSPGRVVSAVIVDQSLVKGNAYYSAPLKAELSDSQLNLNLIASRNGPWLGAVVNDAYNTSRTCKVFHIPGIGYLESIAELVMATPPTRQAILTQEQTKIFRDMLTKDSGFHIPESWQKALKPWDWRQKQKKT